MIKVKEDTQKPKHGVENSISIDGDKNVKVFNGYQFASKSKFDIVPMSEILLDHDKKKTSSERKIDLKAMVNDSKKRKKTEIFEDEAAFASSIVKKSARSNKSQVKTKTTLKLSKGKPEITTEIKKVSVKKKRSASGRKLSTAAKLLAKSRASSAKKAKAAKTAPNASRKQSAVKGKSSSVKRIGVSRP